MHDNAVVVGVDGSDASLHAVRWASAEAARHAVPLRLITAFAWVDEPIGGHHRLGDPYRQILLKRARTQLVEAAAVAEGVDPSVPIEKHVVVGQPIAVLGEQARSAGLLVVGAIGEGRLAAALTGSVAVAMATRAACHTVVVRGHPDDDREALPILVGVDGTPASDAAIAFAFDAASTRRVALVAMHTYRKPFAEAADDGDRVSAEHREVLAERLAGWAEKYPDVRVQRLVAQGRPANRLIEQADQAQLLVVGSRGHGELAGLVLGSVSNAAVHGAPCPVAVVRTAATRTP